MYIKAYHALMKPGGMYPSHWGNDMMADQFVGGSMLLSWDLTTNDSNGFVYMSPSEGQSEIRQAAADHHPADSLCPVWQAVGDWQVPHSGLWLQCLMFSLQLQEALRRDPRVARTLVGVYASVVYMGNMIYEEALMRRLLQQHKTHRSRLVPVIRLRLLQESISITEVMDQWKKIP